MKNLRSNKQKLLQVEENIPEGVKEYIDRVNVFIEEVELEDPIGPMICNSSIQLNENELRFLTRGPKFMMRNEIDIKEFTVDVEKMIVKEGYNGEENEGMNDDGVE